jgi:HAD superfamily hydrolase (TIGR01509 family)
VIRALLLDLDDTLVDRDAAVRGWLRAWLPAPVAIEPLVALDRGGRGPRRALFAAVAALARVSAAAVHRSFVREVPARMRLRPDADALLRRFGGATAIVSNGPGRLQRAKIAAAGLVGRVDHVLVSGEHGARKPDPAIFRAALALTGVGADEALVVGDDPATDLAGARAAGIAAVLVRSPWCEPPPGVRWVAQLDEVWC